MDNNPIHVLLVEDNPGDARLVRELVREASDLSIHHVENLASGLAYLATGQVEVVLLDLGLPDSSGMDTLRAVLRSVSALPVVVLTGQNDEEVGRLALREGAQDYLAKGHVEEGSLTRAIRYAIERKNWQKRDQFARALLELLNFHDTGSNQIREILELVRKSTGIEAVAIRLRDGDDYPYFETHGFPQDFVVLDRSLCARNENNEILRDAEGNPILECMCGNILRGRTNPALPFFTEGGSFWSNCTTELLASTTDADRLAHTCNRCNDAGYESVALIPLRSPEGIIGLLQFNDRRSNRFDLEMIRFFEGMGASIGIALTRSRAQEALVRSAGQWTATFDAMADMVCVLSPDHEFLEINRAGCLMLGLERKKIIGRKCYELVHGTDAPIPGCPCSRTIGTGERACGEIEEGGKAFSLVSWPSLGTDGHVVSLSHIIKDVTQLKRSQQRHEQLEDQLRATQKMEAIGSLAGGVAHDFNNLLSVILSYTGFAMDAVRSDSPVMEDLREVKNAGERAAVLTSQLLAFSRKQVLQPKTLNVNQIAVGLENMLRRILGEDVELVQKLAPELGRVLADQGQIEQVMMNLVVNARDAMPRGGRLTIETSNVEVDEEYASRCVGLKAGAYVQIAVSDTGCGMDEATRNRIFEPFFTTKEKGKGTGLGLAMVYGIVKQSDGYIEVTSEPDRGTVFRIYLPHDHSSGSEPVIGPVAGQTRATGTETILVVEDEEALRRVIRRALVAAGYTVMVAIDGDEALEFCREHDLKLDLLLTDVVMPRMSGKELALLLLENRPLTRVLYMSGYTGDAIVHHGVLDAGTHFLAKPFTMAGLQRKVREVLDEGSAVLAPVL